MIFAGENEEPEELVDRNCACCKTNCKPRNLYVCWLRFQNRTFTLISDPLFDFGIAVLILLNTLLLCLYWDGMSDTQELILDILTDFVCLLYCIIIFEGPFINPAH